MKPQRARSCTAVVALLSAMLILPTALSGQTLGLDFGLAGIENHDPFTPGIGASVTIPILSRVSVSASYARWVGRDGNEALLVPGGDLRSGYGNQAFLVSGLARVLGSTGTTLSAGAGVGWFQHFRVEDGASESWYDATPVGTLLVRFGASNSIVPYARADVQIPNQARLNYGLMRIGAEISLR